MNLLFVQSDPGNLKSLEALAGRLLPGAAQTGFQSADAALEYIKSSPVDVAVLELPMERGTGLSLAKALRRKNPRANILFCSDSSKYAMDAWLLDASAYLLRPVTQQGLRHALENLRYAIQSEKRVTFRCFGNFEACCDGRPIQFKYRRTKELLAYLVDRNGVSCSIKELGGILFEDDRHRSYLYHIRLDLLNTLTRLGVEDILVQTRGHLGIAREKVSCDYYDFLDHKIQAPVQEYMTQYSFSEQTFGTLFLEAQK